MGEAKNRGTYEERKAAAIKRNKEAKKKLEELKKNMDKDLNDLNKNNIHQQITDKIEKQKTK